MSYRLIDSNAIAIKYPEVNEMPCVYADLPDGLNGQFIDAQPEPSQVARDIATIIENEKDMRVIASAQPDLDEWCNTCREYDSERHCCPRFNRVIRDAVEEVKEERIYCKDCKHRGTDDCPMYFVEWIEWDDDGYMEYDDVVTDNTTDDGYCHKAEGREAND